MAYVKKIWKNRQSETPNRRQLAPVPDREGVYDVTREEGCVFEEGSAFDQVNMNDLEVRVANAFGELVTGAVKAGKAVEADTAKACTGNAATATVAASANAVAWGNVNTKPATFPPSSHGNHVPAVQGANNKVFLRNDNTWQTITPANIGAEPAFAKNNAFNKVFGTAAGTVCQGNDSRLANARPASGGNADTVDGFHVAGKGTGRPGSLAENALYFVYE